MKQLQGNPQKEISRNVERRGYYDGYEPGPLLARHVAKMQEELKELAWLHTLADVHVAGTIDAAGNFAKASFDNDDWTHTGISPMGHIVDIKSELADVLVVVMSMAELINKHFGPYDVIQAALEKSGADVERGVR